MLGNTLARAALPLALLLSAQAQAELPAPLKQLEVYGVEVSERIDAPKGLEGYMISMGGQFQTAFVTEDHKHMVIGSLVDAQGNNLSNQMVQEAKEKLYANAWELLEKSHWVADGPEDAKRVVYTFTDPNCPFCNRFWRQYQPWLATGDVQVRHILVGILGRDSKPKAAAMLTAKDPAAALHQHNTVFDNGGIKASSKPSPTTAQQLNENHSIMRQLGVSATPVTFYKDANGKVQVREGAPPEQELPLIMGSKKP
ncbi:MAG TPA: thiol:disulfide interchange protein DsbG [Alcanivoracaceae bacterium]|nr:thiol:disulfide interchange protein DsbG [Alcanivoracaceae bacterium]